MVDHIFVSNLCVHGHHGLLPEENRLGQKFYIDIDCSADVEECAREDNYSKAICYSTLCDLAVEVSSSGPFKLVETFATRIGQQVLARFSMVSAVSVRIRKPSAPIRWVFDDVGVEVNLARKTRIGLSLGSNVGDKAANIRAALSLLAQTPGIRIDASSHFYRTAPWGNQNQDWFLNACALAEVHLTPDELLETCKSIEVRLGRTPGVRWGPRIIDIDLLFFGDRTISSERLTLPHPEMLNRAFVLVPLVEIAPGVTVSGQVISDALAALPRNEGDVARLD